MIIGITGNYEKEKIYNSGHCNNCCGAITGRLYFKVCQRQKLRPDVKGTLGPCYHGT